MSRQRYQFTVGDRCKSVKEIHAFNAIIPAGTVFTVRNRYKGYELEADGCVICGVKLRVKHVPQAYVERA